MKEVTLDSEAMARITRITSMATSPSTATSKPTHAQDLNDDVGGAEEQEEEEKKRKRLSRRRRGFASEGPSVAYGAHRRKEVTR